jgi:hypothetical protein
MLVFLPFAMFHQDAFFRCILFNHHRAINTGVALFRPTAALLTSPSLGSPTRQARQIR